MKMFYICTAHNCL